MSGGRNGSFFPLYIVLDVTQAAHTEKYWVLHNIKLWSVSWFTPSPELMLSFSHTELNHSVNFLFCFSDCDNVRFQSSSYAALHRGRPPERPSNCKKPLPLGRSGLTQYPSVMCFKKKKKNVKWTNCCAHYWYLYMVLLWRFFKCLSMHTMHVMCVRTCIGMIG